RALSVSDTTIFVGGSFDTINGEQRNRLACLSTISGTLSGWQANANNDVNALAISDTTLYVGGSYTAIGGLTRNRISSLSVLSGSVLSWNPNASGTVNTIAVEGNLIYIGGAFNNVNSTSHPKIAAIDSLGVPTSWNPVVNNTVLSIAFNDTTIYIGGSFSTVGGISRKRFAAVGTSGVVSNLIQHANDDVRALVYSGSSLFIGGDFSSIGGETRNNIAAFNTTTGSVTDFDPNANDVIYSITHSGNIVYAGGLFSSIGEQTRNYLAALDGITGIATDWNPNPDEEVDVITTDNGKIYAGGYFFSIGGASRKYLAELDSATGTATGWNPSPNSNITSLAVKNSTLYVGGYFTLLGDSTRNYLAAYNNAGNLIQWNPNPDYAVYALAATSSFVYVGGDFANIGDSSRNKIAAIDISTGLTTEWNPGADLWVQALVVSGSTVYAGGGFSYIGNEDRNYVAALDASTGLATDWDPNSNSDIFALGASFSEGKIYVAGEYTNIYGSSRRGFVSFDDPQQLPYTISATTGSNGSISPSGVVSVANGASKTYTFTTRSGYPGYRIDSIYVDNVFAGQSPSYTFTNVTSHKTIRVTFALNDTTRFRTFRVDTSLARKPIKLKPKKGAPAILPNVANWRDTAVFRSGGKSGMVVGIAQPKETAKFYGWIRYKKGTDMGKFYSVLHTDSAYNSPFDSVRKAGASKKKIFVKELKPNALAYTNPFAQEFSTFKLNVLSSLSEVTPSGFASLRYVNFGNPFNDLSLVQMYARIDSLLTYYKTKKLSNGDSAYVGAPMLETLRKTLKAINDGYADTISFSNGDTVANGRLKFTGTVELFRVPFLRRPFAKEQIEYFQPNTSEIPNEFALYQNYPNPFNPVTVIRYQLSVSSVVSLKVYDILGREVTTLLNNEQLEEGEHELEFNASAFSSGVYFYRLTANNGKFSDAKKLMLLK
ncbi:MAG: T9SS type A sorting domain-containing protein, partial [Ignavibacteriales bacterium]|nr:T9SS type A sorting domain-containing protein [Ignavibacteriales bacterium]